MSAAMQSSSDTILVVQGSCYCGAVKYEAQGPFYHETNCHCEICRKTCGAPFVSWFSARKAGFRWLQGEPAQFRSSETAVRKFCKNCGTQLSFEVDRLNEIDLTTASLDKPELLPPKVSLFTPVS